MTNEDKQEFSRLLSATMATYDMRLTADATSVWWGALQNFTLAQIRAAMQAHVTDPEIGVYFPKPANLIRTLQRIDGWIGAEEAWAIVAPTLNDESVSVVWTQPMATAFGVALGVSNDEVAARMAFIEVYKREMGDARARGDEPRWQLSPGTNAGARDAAITEAVRLGRLSREHAQRLLSPAAAELAQDSRVGGVVTKLADALKGKRD